LDHDDKILIFGGSSPPATNETWVYDLSDNQWEQKSPTSKPGTRAYPGMTNTRNDDKFVVFGDSNETWVYDLDAYSSPGTFTSAPNNTGGPTNFLNLTWSADLPTSTSISFQFKTGKTLASLLPKKYLGPDGSQSTFYNSSGTSIWTGHDGDVWMQYRAYFRSDANTSTPTLYDIMVSYNRIPDSPNLTTPANDTWVTDSRPTFNWTFRDADSAGQGAFRWQADADSLFSSIDYDSNNTPSAVESYRPATPMKDGSWYWRVSTQDCDGAWGNYSGGRMVKVDSGPPSPFTPGVLPSIWTNCTTPQVVFQTTDNGSGLDHYEVRVDSGPFSTQASPYTIPQQTEGVHVATVRAYDKIGFYRDENVTIYIDLKAPKAFAPYAVPGNWTNNTQPQVFFSTTDETSGMNHYELKIDNGEFGRQTSPYTLPPQVDGVHTVAVRAYDNATNSCEGIAKVYIDTVPPNSFTAVAAPHNWTCLKTPTISFNTTDNTSGIARYEVRVDNESFSVQTSPYILPPLGEGKHAVKVRAFDQAGNIAESIVNVYVDTEPPTQVSIALDGGAIYTENQTVSIDISATDLCSGVREMTFSDDGIQYSTWEPFKTQKSWTFPSAGKKLVYFKARDAAGNEACATAEIIYAPVARIVVTPSTVTVGLELKCQFTAKAYDSGNRELPDLPYVWTVPVGVGSIDSTGLFMAGKTPATGKVTAGFAHKSGMATVVVVQNKAPVVGSISQSSLKIGPDETLNISTSGSSDPDGDILQFLFDFGDGSTSEWINASSTSHSYSKQGKYDLKFKVRDDKDAESGWSPIKKVEVVKGGGGGTMPASSDYTVYLLLIIPIGAVAAGIGLYVMSRKKKVS